MVGCGLALWNQMHTVHRKTARSDGDALQRLMNLTARLDGNKAPTVPFQVGGRRIKDRVEVEV